MQPPSPHPSHPLLSMLRATATGLVLLLAITSPLGASYQFGTDVRVNDTAAGLIRHMIGAGQKTIAARDDTVYVVWQDSRHLTSVGVFLSRSIDGGQTFGPDLRLSDTLSECSASALCLAPPTSDIYVAWTARGPLPDEPDTYGIYFARSVDGGSSFSDPLRLDSGLPHERRWSPATAADTSANVYVAWIDTRSVAPHSTSIYIATSNDSGTSFSPDSPVELGELYGPEELALSTGPERNLYLTFEDAGPTGEDALLHTMTSCDGGFSFRPPVYITHSSFWPSTSVTDDGILHVFYYYHYQPFVWPDTTQVRYSRSLDRGLSFTPPLIIEDIADGLSRVSLSSADHYLALAWTPRWNEVHFTTSANSGQGVSPPQLANDYLLAGVAYPAVALTSHGNMALAWADWRDGRTAPDIYADCGSMAAPVSPEPPVNSTQTSRHLVLFPPAPNPIRGGTSIRYGFYPSLSNPEDHLTLSIYDARGRLVRQLLTAAATRGVHQVWWDATDNRGVPVGSGLYFCRLGASNEACTVSVLVVR